MAYKGKRISFKQVSGNTGNNIGKKKTRKAGGMNSYVKREHTDHSDALFCMQKKMTGEYSDVIMEQTGCQIGIGRNYYETGVRNCTMRTCLLLMF